MKTISKYFINGLIVTVPIAITSFVILEAFSFAEQLLGRHLPFHFPGVGLIAVLFLIVAVGWASTHWAARQLLQFGEKLLGQIPFIKFIYNSVKQLSSAVFESHNLFRYAVLIPYPHPGVKTLGFLTPELSPAIRDKLTEDHVCVFVPMSLNMTAGFNIIVPKKDVIPLEVTGESALQYILTAGSVMPHGDAANKT